MGEIVQELRMICAGVLGSVAITGIAKADPCEAIQEAGPLPPYAVVGRDFSGPVVYVGDGDSLCVAVAPDRGHWVEVRLADFYAPELSSPEGPSAKAALEEVALGRLAVCRARKKSYDRVVAACTIDGHSIAQSMRASGIKEGGRGYDHRGRR